MKCKFTEWYCSCISAQLAEGKETEDVEVPIKLSVLKPLHAKWVIDLFNYFTSQKGRQMILNGWKAACISEALSSGSLGLEPLDPFQAADPLTTEKSNTETYMHSRTEGNIKFFVNPKNKAEDDREDNWVINGEEVKNIFDVVDDFLEDDI